MANYVPWYLKSATDRRLKAFGKMGDTQDQVVNRILDLLDKRVSKSETKREPKCFLSEAGKMELEKYGDNWEEDPENEGWEILMDNDTMSKVLGRRKVLS